MCTECKCAYHQNFYCSKFKNVIEIQNNIFWTLTICEQIEKLSLCIDARKADCTAVKKNAMNMSKPCMHRLLYMIENHLWMLETLCQFIIVNDTK